MSPEGVEASSEVRCQVTRRHVHSHLGKPANERQHAALDETVATAGSDQLGAAPAGCPRTDAAVFESGLVLQHEVATGEGGDGLLVATEVAHRVREASR